MSDMGAVVVRVKQLWDVWNIRGAILFSLWLQIFLIFVGPIKKSARKGVVVMLIWSAYLMADGVANFAIGLISNSQQNQSHKSLNHHAVNNDLLAFWAPFLLVHLGGCDTVTAFALEDNQLWLRHLLAFGFQVAAVVYVFIQSLPNDNLWIPIMLVFIAGIIKYVERTRALFLASMDRFGEPRLKDLDPGPNYAKFMGTYTYKKDAKLPTRMNLTSVPTEEIKASNFASRERELTDHLDVLDHAYHFFNIFKGLIANLFLRVRELDESRDFSRKITPDCAPRIIEVELNFLYGALYTKVEVLHSVIGFIFRFLAFASVLAALQIFYFQINKKEFTGVEIEITYTLLLGAIALDLISFIMFIFSDRTFASINNAGRLRKWLSLVVAIVNRYLALKKPRWHPCKCKVEHHVLVTNPFPFRRWSGAISMYNLIGYCLNRKRIRTHEFISLFDIICGKLFQKIHGCLKIKLVVDCIPICWSKRETGSTCFIISRIRRFSSFIKEKLTQYFSLLLNFIPDPIKDYVDQVLYVSLEPITRELWTIIFMELKHKTELTDDSPEIANKIFAARGNLALDETYSTLNEMDHLALMRSVIDAPYDESLLLWHIATDLCFYVDNDATVLASREMSKILSDYMLYLLVFQPTMMSAVAGIGKIRFRDTCAEAKRFFKSRGLQPNHQKACEEILSVNTVFAPVDIKGGRSKSVLFDAVKLARVLNEMRSPSDKWKLVSKVWIELMSYAASHCRPNTHAQQLSMGGEFITFVWLLVAHFGLAEHFNVNKFWLFMTHIGGMGKLT